MSDDPKPVWKPEEVRRLITLTIAGYLREQQEKRKTISTQELAELIYAELKDRYLIDLNP